MPVRPIHQPVMTFRWNRRRAIADDPYCPYPVPVVRVLESPELPPEELSQAFADMPLRQWSAIKQLMLEAKFKAESMLRDDRVIANSNQLAYYTGWVVYADYVISSLENVRSGLMADTGQPLA